MLKRDTLKVIFLAMTVFSVVSLVRPTLNYVEFYAVMQSLNLQVTDINFSIGQDEVNVTVNFIATNPTGYVGLTFKSLLCWLFYEGEKHTTIPPWGPYVGTPYQGKIETRWWELKAESLSYEQTLNPYSNITISINFNAVGEQAKRFIEFFEKEGRYQEYIRWELRGLALIQTASFINTLRYGIHLTYP